MHRKAEGGAVASLLARTLARSFSDIHQGEHFDLRTLADVTELAGVLASLPLE